MLRDRKKGESFHHVAKHPGIMVVFSLDGLLESPQESLQTEMSRV